MGKVVIKALAGKVQNDEGKTTMSASQIDGLECDDDFVEYFDGDFSDKLESGYMTFKEMNGNLYTVTTYTTTEELNEAELHELGEYTQGQWSDGLGEGFEQFPYITDDNDDDVYVSPWFSGQKLIIEQE